ncbi:UNVERIFIED_CONTAM: hypothetical protein GTU68_062507 [Idotea baltica]|nr:hypothetical protein [Idotea baltica]
MNRSFAK